MTSLIERIFLRSLTQFFVSFSGHVLFRRGHSVLKLPLFAVMAVLIMPGSTTMARSTPDGFADLTEKLSPAVVNISTSQIIQQRGPRGIIPNLPQLPPGHPLEKFFEDFLGTPFPNQRQPQPRPEQRGTSLGSGFIIDAQNGYIITNNHVIADSEEITVVLSNNNRVKAELIGTDSRTDIAVLQIDTNGSELTAVSFGDSDKARVGDWVLAIGNPFGLGGTVTAGIISARGRDINAGPYDDFIQTDASINRGNSGGPLFNLQGEVIGVNTAIFSPSGGSVGIGFSIPANIITDVIGQLIENGTVRRGWLGVSIQTVTEELADTLNLESPMGALVSSLAPDGPASKAGILPGDVIIRFDGQDIPEMRKLPRLAASTEVGRTVPVVVWRKGQKKTIRVTLGTLPEEQNVAARMLGTSPKVQGSERHIDRLGLTLVPVTEEAMKQHGLEEIDGVLVSEITPDGPAASKNIVPGDIITEINQEAVSSPREVAARVEDAVKSGKESILLRIYGQGGPGFVAIKMSE